MTNYELDVIVTRGEIVESRHRVSAAVVDCKDRLVGGARDAGLVTVWRSCAKPFQVIPLLESGGFDSLGWDDDELALSCASHGGEPEHVAIAESMLRDLGLEEGDLACGAHEPLSSRGVAVLRESGARATRLHNNCSGKHAAMLARAMTSGWPTRGYERAGHPVQDGILSAVARWCGLQPGAIGQAVDGCGAVVFSMPLESMARAYARLAVAVRYRAEVASRVVGAMTSMPFLVGGTDRFDTVLLEESDGRILTKIGAEGVHCVAALDSGIGIAVKAEDGAQRAQYAAVLRLLQYVGALPAELPPRLAEFLRRPVRNTRGELVGSVQPAA